jgi:hypothetical protein
MERKMTKEEILKAQEKWAEGIISIGAEYSNKGDYVKAAQTLIDQLYAYDISPVLFKPTKAREKPFRKAKQEALSYFVASNNECSEDKGFALRPWKSVRFENDNFVVLENTGLAMGNYFFTDFDGGEIKVEYSFSYILDAQGKLLINLHHSSLPFSG